MTEFERWSLYVYGRVKVKYTVRFAHLEKAPIWKAGDVLARGDVVGVMGSSGQSTATHLHIDCVKGAHDRPYTLKDIADEKPEASSHELFFFIDSELFGVALVITTQFDDTEYLLKYGKLHKGYDVVPEDRKKTREHYPIHWNRSKSGTVSLVVDDPKGYGHCIYIVFEV